MIEFKEDRPIYRQIVDYGLGCILSGSWEPGQRVPSVREMSVQLAVNSHTVLKAYEFLQDHGLIVARRGMGFYLADDAMERVNEIRREEFFSDRIPALVRDMKLLHISLSDLNRHLEDALGDGPIKDKIKTT